MQKPFAGSFPITQNFNDPRYRASYLKFGILGHNGIDYGTPTGTPISTPHSGKIIEATNDVAGYGS
jgi:murein DD-endopeptidase MepM/ murein hydrolase activator NlpD